MWLPIPGYEGLYEVSDDGQVRSIGRRGKTLSAYPVRGYMKVHLSKDGVARQRGVHQLVMLAFEGPTPGGMEVCHNDGNRANNSRSNLRYGTPSDNGYDRVKHGTCGQSRKTQCPAGHKYDEANTRWVKTPSGMGRQCRECNRVRQLKRRKQCR